MAKPKQSKYGSLRDQVVVGKEQTEGGGGGEGALNIGDKKFWKPKEKGNIFDIIPYEVTIPDHPKGIPAGNLYQQLKYKIHFNVGPDDKAVVCPGTFGKKCPICEARAVMVKDPNADKEELNELRPRDRIVFNIIDLNDEDAGIQIFDMSPHLFAKKLYEELDAQNGEYDSVFDLDGGFSLKVRFSKKKLGKNEFLEVSRIDFAEREPYDDSIIDETLDLDKALNVLSYEAIDKLFLGLEDADVKSEVIPKKEEPTPRTSRRAPAKEEPADTQEEEQEEEALAASCRRHTGRPEPDPVPSTIRSSRKPTPKPEEPEEQQDNECPNGLTFALDCEKYTECDTCDIWENCRKALDEKEKAAKPSRGRK